MGSPVFSDIWGHPRLRLACETEHIRGVRIEYPSAKGPGGSAPNTQTTQGGWRVHDPFLIAGW